MPKVTKILRTLFKKFCESRPRSFDIYKQLSSLNKSRVENQLYSWLKIDIFKRAYRLKKVKVNLEQKTNINGPWNVKVTF
jgi:hypothetical protein